MYMLTLLGIFIATPGRDPPACSKTNSNGRVWPRILITPKGISKKSKRLPDHFQDAQLCFNIVTKNLLF